MALTFVAFVPYIHSIRRGKTRPHVFSWVIWGSTTLVICLAQLAGDGGVGAWPIGVSGLITLYVAWLAFVNSADNTITAVDRVFFIAALPALPLWYLTSDPFWAVVILTTVDVIGFGPTFRKAYCLPAEEQLSFFVLMTLRNLAVIMALEHYSVTTVLFPAATGLACLLLILMLMYRRRLQ